MAGGGGRARGEEGGGRSAPQRRHPEVPALASPDPRAALATCSCARGNSGSIREERGDGGGGWRHGGGRRRHGGGLQTWTVIWLFAEWLPHNTSASLPTFSCPSAACHNKSEWQRVAGSGWGGWGERGGGVVCADLHCNVALRRAFAPQLPRLAPDDLLPFCGLPQQKASGGEWPVAFGGAVVSGTVSS